MKVYDIPSKQLIIEGNADSEPTPLDKDFLELEDDSGNILAVKLEAVHSMCKDNAGYL